MHRFPCRRRFHGPPIDIDGAARLGVRHTADHPRELLPSTIAACSGVATVPGTCPVTTGLAGTGHRPPGRGQVVVPPPARGRKGSTVTVGGRRGADQRRRGRWRPECGDPPGRCASWSAGDSRGGTAGDAHRMPTHRHEDQNPPQFNTGAAARLGVNILVPRSQSGHRRRTGFHERVISGPELPHERYRASL